MESSLVGVKPNMASANVEMLLRNNRNFLDWIKVFKLFRVCQLQLKLLSKEKKLAVSTMNIQIFYRFWFGVSFERERGHSQF